MFFVVKVSAFMNGTKLDKNGNAAVYLDSQNGPLPERARVLSGTIAKTKDFQVGNLYLLRLTDLGEGDYGTNYQHDNIGVVNALDFAIKCTQFPAGVVQKAPTVETSKPAAKVSANAVQVPVLDVPGDELDF